MIDPRLDRFLASQPTAVDTAAAQLSALVARQAADKEAWLEKLRQHVRGLDDSAGDLSSTSPGEIEGQGAEPQGQRFRPPQPQPEWKPPQRRTHGGNFGPAVMAKLRREALGG